MLKTYPKVTNQLFYCPNCFSTDLYQGCTHGCEYCFAKFYKEFDFNSKDGDYAADTSSRDYTPILKCIDGKLKVSEIISSCAAKRQPLHIGGMADPFPRGIEERTGHSLGFIKAVGDYPCIWSTKNPIPAYAEHMAKGNHILQCSVSCIDGRELLYEAGCMSGLDRLQALRAYKGKIAKVMVRLQPYIPELFTDDSMRDLLDRVAEVADGITIEFLKLNTAWKNKEKLSSIIGVDLKSHMVSLNKGEMVYTESYRYKKLMFIINYCHSIGLEVYCADNRFRYLGDSANCCGISPKDADIWQTKLSHNSSNMLFLAKANGKVTQEEFTSEIGDGFNMAISGIYNAGNRTNYFNRRLVDLRGRMIENWTQMSDNNPAVMYKVMKPHREADGTISYVFDDSCDKKYIK